MYKSAYQIVIPDALSLGTKTYARLKLLCLNKLECLFYYNDNKILIQRPAAAVGVVIDLSITGEILKMYFFRIKAALSERIVNAVQQACS